METRSTSLGGKETGSVMHQESTRAVREAFERDFAVGSKQHMSPRVQNLCLQGVE